MKRRRRLFVRQSLAYREGKSHDPSWHVGYWDNKPRAMFNGDNDFRSFGSRPTEAEAVKLAEEIVKKNKEFIF
jgi:hypothetical protein